jgi:hypothetical protein
VSASARRAFVEAVCVQLGELRPLLAGEASEEARDSVLELCRRLLNADARAVVRSDVGSAFVIDALARFLARGQALEFKAYALDLLPGLFRAMPSVGDARLERVAELVTQVVVYDFPMRSADLKVGSAAYGQYVACIDKLLFALRVSGSSRLLKLLYPLLREESHAYATEIDDALLDYVLRLAPSEAARTFDECARAVLDATNPSALRLALARKLCVPLLARCTADGRLSAFEAHVDALMDAVARDVAAAPASTVGVLLTSKMCSLELLAAFYRRLSKRTISERVRWSGGNKLTSGLLRQAHAAIHEHVASGGPDAPSGATVLAYKAVAYAALASVVIRTQTNVQFYEVFFFKQKPQKNEYVWEQVVDTHAQLTFDVETDFPYKTWRQLVAMDAAEPALQRARFDRNRAVTGRRADTRYISSVYLNHTSLSHDLSHMGGVMSLDADDNDNERDAARDAAAASDASESEAVGAPPVVVDGAAADDDDVTTVAGASSDWLDERFELDYFNSNPCMLPLLRLIDHLERHVAPPPIAGAVGDRRVPVEMPVWMQSMLEKLQPGSGIDGHDTHPNVRMFIAKVVLNRPRVFAPHAQAWLAPLLELACDPRALAQPGRGVHYFLRDLVFLFVDWADLRQVVPESSREKRAASRFVAWLMSETYADRPSVIRGTVKLIKELFERWRGRFSPSRFVVLQYLTAGEAAQAAAAATGQRGGRRADSTTRRKQTTGLQLLSILVAHGYAPYDDADSIDLLADASRRVSATRLQTALLDLLKEQSKEVYCAAAECAGMVLRAELTNPRSRNALDLKAALHERVSQLFLERQYDRALQTCAKMSNFCGGDFLDPLLNHIFSVLPRLVGEFRLTALHTISNAADGATGTNLYRRLQPHLLNLLNERTDDVQLLTLLTLYRARATLTVKELGEVLPICCNVFPRHRSAACRRLFFEFAQWAWDTHELHPRSAASAAAAVAAGNIGDHSSTSPVVVSSTLAGADSFVAAVSGSASAAAAAAAAAAAGAASTLPPRAVEPLRVALLLGLSDSSPAISTALYTFWSHPTRLAESTDERLRSSLDLLYAPDAEGDWLNYSTRLLLWLARSALGYTDRPLCHVALADAKFAPLAIDASVAHANSQMVPLFHPSLDVGGGSQPAVGQTLSLAPDMQGVLPTGALRGTAVALFTPTMSLGNDLLTVGGDLLRFDFNNAASGGGSVASGSADPSGRRRARSPTARYEARSTQSQFPDPSSASAASSSSSPARPALQPPRRFRKNVSVTAEARGVLRATMQRRKQAAWAKRHREARAAAVNMLRQYRIGELPDVSITSRDIVEPLQALVHADALCARDVYMALFASVLGKEAGGGDGGSDFDAALELRARFSDMLQSSRGTTSFAGTVLLLCARYPLIAPPAAVVGHAARRSLSFQAGILMLEEQLLVCDADQSTTRSVAVVRDAIGQHGKRRMIDQTRDELQQSLLPSEQAQRAAWLELGALYKALGEADIVTGVNSEHVARLQATRDALAAVARGDFARAEKLFNKARGAIAVKQSASASAAVESSPHVGGDKKRARPSEADGADSSATVSGVSAEERAMLSSEQLDALAQIGRWSKMAAVISDECRDPVALLSAGGEPLLVAQSWVRLAVRDRARWPELWRTIDRLPAARRAELEGSWLPAELALVSVARHDFERAEYVVRRFRRAFLDAWPRFHPLARAARRIYLRRLQPVAEIEEFLVLARRIGIMQAASGEAAAAAVAAIANDEALDDEDVDAPPNDAALVPARAGGSAHVTPAVAAKLHRRLLRRWRRRLPALDDSTSSWDDVACVRDTLLDKLRSVANDEAERALVVVDSGAEVLSAAERERNHRIWRGIATQLAAERCNLLRLMAHGATRQGNLAAADEYLKRFVDLRGAHAPFDFEFCRALVHSYSLRATEAMDEKPRDGVQRYVKGLHYMLEKVHGELAHAPHHEPAYLRQRAGIVARLFDVAVGRHASDVEAALEADAIVRESIRAESSGATELSDRLAAVTIACLERAKRLARAAEAPTLSDDEARQQSALLGAGGDGFDDDADDVAAATADDLQDAADYVTMSGDGGADDALRARAAAVAAASAVDSVRSAARALLQLAEFSDRVLRLREAEAVSRGDAALDPAELRIASHSLPLLIVENVLGALRLGSADASDLLPRVLDLLGRHRALVMRDFKSGAVRVPAWRFARWLTQMMSRLDKPEGDVVAVIVIAVARQLPHAAFYAFNVARQSLEACAAVRRVERHVMLPHLQKFIAELRRLTHPELRLKAWRDHVRQRIDEPDSPARTEFMRDRFAELRDIMRTDATAGTYNKHFAKARAAAVFGATGANGEKLRTLRKKQFDTLTDWSFDVPSDQKGAYKSLADFSPWLAHYDDSDRTVGAAAAAAAAGDASTEASDATGAHSAAATTSGAAGDASVGGDGAAADGIELPGQYDPLSHVPPPTSSLRVASFAQAVQVLTSIRVPKRLVMHGADEREHSFLVKGGEDLRQDERIQELFGLMNALFARDAQCVARGVGVRRYLVLPVATDVGLIEWMNGTRTMRDVIQSVMWRPGTYEHLLFEAPRKGSKKGRQGIYESKAAELYFAWLRSKGKADNTARNVLAAFSAARRDPEKHLKEARDNFLNAVQQLPWDLLRRGLMALAPSPEAFLALRTQYARSLGAVSVTGWLCGIGDRHLDNLLISNSDGRVVPIDFGHAFGSATQWLPVPEFIPFRLTRQMVGVLRPLGTQALLEPAMISALSVLHTRREVLLRALDVFVRDPIADWASFAARVPERGQDAMRAMALEANADEDECDGARSQRARQRRRLASTARARDC